MSHRINCGGTTATCQPHAARPTGVGATVTVIVMGDALEHTTVTGGVVVVVVTGDIISNTLQKKKTSII